MVLVEGKGREKQRLRNKSLVVMALVSLLRSGEAISVSIDLESFDEFWYSVSVNAKMFEYEQVCNIIEN